MGEGIFKPHFETNDGEINEASEEAEKVLKEKYPDYVTEQPKPNDGSIEIAEKDVNPEDLKKAMDEAVEAIEKQDQKAA